VEVLYGAYSWVTRCRGKVLEESITEEFIEALVVDRPGIIY
jgi:hypothetical protein